ncbi:MAG TPA: molybdopterin oxidoreductase family protein [Actinomycetota bacterium]|nr:molybdopterin oxidoreductase family protein [Actinomycetota bacterium]
METFFRTCPLCEATCGLAITMDGDRVAGIRGDDEDVFSHGYICPKGTTLGDLHHDPDRIRRPLIKRDGRFVEATFDEAFAEIERRLPPILAEHGRDAVGLYIGNPTVHNMDSTIFVKPMAKAIGTRNIFSASTVDQRPKELACAWMYGGGLTVPIPDIDRTDYLLILGANPLDSNGSLATAPDWPGRLKAIRKRGGRVVVVDPRRTNTAAKADEHIAIRPGGDAFFLAAVAHTIFDEGLVTLGTVDGHVSGLDEAREAVEPFTPDAVAAACGIDAATIVRIARELAAAPSAAVYGRIGTTTQEFGTLASWLVDVCNIVTGNMDRPGGVMFPKAAAGASNTRPGKGRTFRIGRFTSRVRGAAETLGELPSACLAEEIDTAGEGQIRAMITIAGNPVLSTPDGARLDRALAGLDFMVSVDVYLNETTRHADVILPPPEPLQRSHYDLAFWQLSVRNVANYSPAILPLQDGQMHEWEILSVLATIAQTGTRADPSIVDDLVAMTVAQGVATESLTAEQLLEATAARRGPERILDIMLRGGPYDLTLDDLLAAPHGVDLGPLQPRIPEILRTESGKIECAPPPLIADLARLRAALDRPANGMMLIGRRHLRSNNSWGHNVPAMVKGRDRCTLMIHPADATRLGLEDGKPATIVSGTGTLVAPVEITDDIREGVVSLPHGWGHDLPGIRLSVASSKPGVNTNLLTPSVMDALSGNAVLNGIPVEISA